jgi:hypothetical protein
MVYRPEHDPVLGTYIVVYTFVSLKIFGRWSIYSGSSAIITACTCSTVSFQVLAVLRVGKRSCTCVRNLAQLVSWSRSLERRVPDREWC